MAKVIAYCMKHKRSQVLQADVALEEDIKKGKGDTHTGISAI